MNGSCSSRRILPAQDLSHRAECFSWSWLLPGVLLGRGHSIRSIDGSREQKPGTGPTAFTVCSVVQKSPRVEGEGARIAESERQEGGAEIFTLGVFKEVVQPANRPRDGEAEECLVARRGGGCLHATDISLAVHRSVETGGELGRAAFDLYRVRPLRWPALPRLALRGGFRPLPIPFAASLVRVVGGHAVDVPVVVAEAHALKRPLGRGRFPRCSFRPRRATAPGALRERRGEAVSCGSGDGTRGGSAANPRASRGRDSPFPLGGPPPPSSLTSFRGGCLSRGLAPRAKRGSRQPPPRRTGRPPCSSGEGCEVRAPSHAPSSKPRALGPSICYPDPAPLSTPAAPPSAAVVAALRPVRCRLLACSPAVDRPRRCASLRRTR